MTFYAVSDFFLVVLFHLKYSHTRLVKEVDSSTGKLSFFVAFERLNLSPPQTQLPSFLEIKFNFKISNFTMQINAYQESTEINAEVNERPLKNSLLVRIGIDGTVDFNEHQLPSP